MSAADGALRGRSRGVTSLFVSDWPKLGPSYPDSGNQAGYADKCDGSSDIIGERGQTELASHTL